MNENYNRKPTQNFFLILLLGILNAVTPFSIDLYLPAFPQIAAGMETTLARVGFSVSSYFVGYALGQLFYGPLLDRFGRKPPLYAGLAVYIFSCAACMYSASIEQLILFRVFQALGGCVAGVAATAMVKDFFPAKEGAKVFSLLMLVLSASPLLAPIAGSFIVQRWGWPAEFAALGIMATVVLALVFFFLPQGHRGDTSVVLSPREIFREYSGIFREPKFHVYTLTGSFSFAGLFVYIAGSPGIFMDEFKVSAEVYSGIFALLAVGLIGGSQLNLVLTKKFTSQKILRTAVASQVAIGGLFLLCVGQGWLGLFATVAFLFALLSCCGLTYPNAAALALNPFTRNAGSAAALLGFLQLGIGSVVSAAVGALNLKGTLPTASVIFVSSAIGLGILIALSRSAGLNSESA